MNSEPCVFLHISPVNGSSYCIEPKVRHDLGYTPYCSFTVAEDSCTFRCPFSLPKFYICPTCGAQPGHPCKRPSGHTVFGGGFHSPREKLAEGKENTMTEAKEANSGGSGPVKPGKTEITKVEAVPESEDVITWLPIGKIHVGDNIREPANLDEMTASIKAQGILEPLLVRPSRHGDPKAEDAYNLVFGGRRFAAAKLAGLKEVPCVVKEMTDGEVIEAQLVENLQREDLSEIDEAKAYQRYITATKSTQIALGKRIGKSQPYIAGRLSLLTLPEKVQKVVSSGEISASKAEVLVSVMKDMPETRVIEAAKIAAQKDVPVARLKNELTWKKKEWAAQDARQKKLAKAWPCPECKRKASAFVNTRYDYNLNAKVGTGVIVKDEEGHMWNMETGKAYVQPKSTYDSTPRPRVERPVKKVGPTMRSGHTVHDIAKAIFTRLGPKEIQSLYWNGTQMSMTFQAPSSLQDLKGVEFRALPHEYSTGELMEIHVEAYDDGRRRKMKEAIGKWQSKTLGKAKAPKKTDPKKVEALKKALDNPIAKVDLPDNVEDLELARDLEVKGQKRHGVIDLIDNFLAALSGEGAGDY